jgi:autotransporter passenger strand-loop-strand repeat protein
VVLSAGHERVRSGGIASATIISAGGFEAVSSGGVAFAAQVSGGTLTVSSGGSILGGVTLHAGTVNISGGMAAGQTVKFSGSAGTLTLNNLAGFHAKISGLTQAAQRIDLGGFAFSGAPTASWTQSGTSGTLVVHDGAKAATLTLIGTYSNASFKLADDHHGGTFIMDPQTTAARFVEVVARVPSGPVAIGSRPAPAPNASLIEPRVTSRR